MDGLRDAASRGGARGSLTRGYVDKKRIGMSACGIFLEGAVFRTRSIAIALYFELLIPLRAGLRRHQAAVPEIQSDEASGEQPEAGN